MRKSIRKRIQSMVLLSTILIMQIAGCANADSDSERGNAANSNTLVVKAWDKNFNIPALRAAEKDYKEHVNPDFELEIIEELQSTDSENAITLAGEDKCDDTLPDIILFQDHSFQHFYEKYPSLWVNLEEIQINWEDFGQEKLSYSTIQNAHYGVPVDNGTVICAYRTDLLEAAGHSLSEMQGITWDKFIEVGQEVTKKTGKMFLSMDGSGNDLLYMMAQAEVTSLFQNGEPNLKDNEAVVDCARKIAKMCDLGVLTLTDSWQEYLQDTIISDKVACVINGNWIIPSIQQVNENSGKWAITEMPTLDGRRGYASNGGSSLYITSNCKNVELAKDFLARTFGGSMQTYEEALKNGGVITCAFSVGESGMYNEGVPYFKGQPIYSDIVEMSFHVPVIEQNSYHYEMQEAISDALRAVRDKKCTVEEALEDAERTMNYIMEITW